MISLDIFRHFDLSKHEALARSESRNHVNEVS